MQNMWSWNPPREDREVPIPRDASLAAAAKNEPPQSPHSLPEDTQPVDVSRDCTVGSGAGLAPAVDHHLSRRTRLSDANQELGVREVAIFASW
jgi:hypothetical protein